MPFLTDPDRDRIRHAIEAAERATEGELVTVVAEAADRYLFVPTLIAAVVALLLPLPLWWGNLLTSPVWLHVAQLAAFLVLLPLLSLPPLLRRLVPAAVQRERAARLARSQFFAQGLHRTRGASGVLLFVSVAEHYVEILADDGIAAKVPQEEWDAIIAEFTALVRGGRVADGFVTAIEATGRLLAMHAPAKDAERNELPDRLIEI